MQSIYNTNMLYNMIYKVSVPYLPNIVETFWDPCVNNNILALKFIENFKFKKIYLNDININNIIKLNNIFIDLPQITTTCVNIFHNTNIYINMFDIIVAYPPFENINYNVFINNIVSSLTPNGIACIILPFDILKFNTKLTTINVLLVVNVPTRKNIKLKTQHKMFILICKKKVDKILF
jgi:hypothetical protein